MVKARRNVMVSGVLCSYWARSIMAMVCLCTLSLPCLAARPATFAAWREGFVQTARQQGISEETIRLVIPNLQYDREVIRFDRRQPEHSTTFASYYRNVITSWRIEEGRRLGHEHKNLLMRLEANYGVPPSIILALWAIESGYGHNTGGYDVMSSLATLAYDGRRAEFFEKELLAALQIVDQDPKLYPLHGSWAGAMGQCQFMPSTYLSYARDGDGDNVRDIWQNDADVLTSIAHYLSQEGWKRDQTWGTEVVLSRVIPHAQQGLDYKTSLISWKVNGVKPLRSASFPAKRLEASLLQFQGTGGRSFLVYDNFSAIMRWNRSTYFATAVGLLADAIQKGL